jgi:4-phosphopantoate--beta-alanine ligase
LSEESTVSPKHPRAESLRIREKLVEYSQTGVVALSGLIAHGRGEAFDYIIGEKTTDSARKAIRAAAAALLQAEHPVISVNGNAAALSASDIVKLAEVTGAALEVNLFHRLPGRDEAIEKVLKEAGAREVLGVGEAASARIPEIQSDRRRVDPRGILIADVVLVPLEDGDRTEALVKMGKTVIAIDLNPLSRTSQYAAITIVDNIVRAMPALVSEAEALKKMRPEDLRRILVEYSNREVLSEAIRLIMERLSDLAEKGIYLSLSK